MTPAVMAVMPNMTPENVAAFALGALIIVTSVALGIPAFRIARSTRDIATTLRQGVETTERHRQEAASQAREAAERAERVRLDLETQDQLTNARTAQEEEDLARAQELGRQNMILLSTISDAITGDMTPPEALTTPAREGWEMAVERMRVHLKAGLKESRTPTQEPPKPTT